MSVPSIHCAALWITCEPDGTAWQAVVMDGRRRVTGAVDPCPWRAARRAVGYAIERMRTR